MDIGKESGKYRDYRDGYCPHPVTLYIKGHIKSYIYIYW